MVTGGWDAALKFQASADGAIACAPDVVERIMQTKSSKRLRIGIIGFGRMGRGFVSVMQQSDVWEIAAICDTHPSTRELAHKTVPAAHIYSDPEKIFTDKSIDIVGLFTLADARPAQIRRAMATGKHVIAEKPIAADSRATFCAAGWGVVTT